MAAREKLLRWLDLIAALLRRHGAATFEEIRRDVPAYAPGSVQDASIMRTFERDKDELRALGIPIQTLADDQGNTARYRLKPEAFYLPYLTICASAMPSALELRSIPRPSGIGFQRLPVLSVTPDERAIFQRAATRVGTLGNASLAADAASAMRKLETDLGPMPVTEPMVNTRTVNADVFDIIGDAMDARKRLTFTYHSIERNITSHREVEPYGLVFLTGHWYLVARDLTAQAIRQFRLSRVSAPHFDGKKAQTPDFDIPAAFNLQDHSASRLAWELGNGDATAVRVQFCGSTGQVAHALRLGRAADDDDVGSRAPARDFEVRRLDRFLRWLLGFAGDARPVAPPEAVTAWQELIRATQTAHQHTAQTIGASPETI